jgi:hypothetical protein
MNKSHEGQTEVQWLSIVHSCGIRIDWNWMKLCNCRLTTISRVYGWLADVIELFLLSRSKTTSCCLIFWFCCRKIVQLTLSGKSILPIFPQWNSQSHQSFTPNLSVYRFSSFCKTPFPSLIYFTPTNSWTIGFAPTTSFVYLLPPVLRGNDFSILLFFPHLE